LTISRPASPLGYTVAALSLVTLTTDFGTRDHYVGALKGVLLNIAPDLHLVDLSHDIPPQDVLAGAFLLRHATPLFPRNTVHLAVVDPGVGSDRRGLAIASQGHLWVGPDNGLFTYALSDGARVYEIADPGLRRESISATFHGRDLFAPAAAHLAAGLPLERVGPPVDDPVLLEEAHPARDHDTVTGSVIHVDGFGNLVTNITAPIALSFTGKCRVQLATGLVIDGLSTTYADVGPDSALALIGSVGLLEISVRGGNAARKLGMSRGDLVILQPPQPRGRHVQH